jgi:hypothetical protein
MSTPENEVLDPLSMALRERGFELFFAVRIASPIINKISVIKEVRMLTGLGLKQAKDAVEQEQVILEALAPDQAEHVSSRLAAAGGNSALLPARAHLYAFVPEHPRRGAQICERLTVVGHTLELARGQLGAWSEAQAIPIGDGELLAAVDRQRASWAAATWCEAGSELEILRRVSAREPQLEARLRDAEGDALMHEAAVYGDWLLAQGDPRGLVASAALSLDAAVDDAERTQRGSALEQIVAEHAVHLLGPARALLDPAPGPAERYSASLRWVGPNLAAVELVGDCENVDQPVLLERLLALPACAGVRTLVLERGFAEHAQLAKLLAHSSCASSLRSIRIEGAKRMSFANAKFERLEQLDLSADELGFAALSVPMLRRLAVEFRYRPWDAWNLELCFGGLDAPQLEHFEFAAYVGETWEQPFEPLQQQLVAVLRSARFARLRTLTLRSPWGSLPYESGLAQSLAQLPARRTLERIDLREAGLEPEALAELEAARAQLPELLLA